MLSPNPIFARLLALCLLILSFTAEAQTLKGLVQDEAGQPVPYVTVKVLNGSAGTVTDLQGNFVIKSEQTNVMVVFSHLGFLQDTVPVSFPYYGTYLHTLRPDVYSIDIVEIEAGKKDPAYAIIREVIRNKRDHVRGPDQFSCNSYVKTVLINDDSTLWKPPREIKFMGMTFGQSSEEEEEEKISTSDSVLLALAATDSLNQDSLLADADTAVVDTGPPSPYMSNFVEMIRTTYYRAPGDVKTMVDGYRDFQNRNAESGGIMISFAGANASEDYRTELQNPLLFIPKYP
ncbi:MAG: carboxypeptidase-like regulatory domain-containing protein, partial [Bacteroidota bacterium]